MSFSIKLLLFVGLFFISPAYLFSQTEENEIIKDTTIIETNIIIDTVVKIDTVIVIEIDTIIVEEPVTDTVIVADPVKKYIKLDFYNDYLSNDISSELSPKKENRNIVQAKLGVGFIALFISFTWDVPIINRLNFSHSYSCVVEIDGRTTNFYGIGLGFLTKMTENSITQFYVRRTFSSYNMSSIIFSIGIDFIYKFFVFNPEIIMGTTGNNKFSISPIFSFGINFKY